MRLLVIRHGMAMDKEEFARTGLSDDERPLTPDGKRQVARVARGLRVMVPALDVLAPSPLVRAEQTAAIVARAYRMTTSRATRALDPDARPAALVRWLAGHSRADTVAVVGHEPHLGILVTWLLTGVRESRIALRKSGACLLELEGSPRRGGAVLAWLMGPEQLQRAAGR